MARTARSFARHTHDQYGMGIIDAGGHRSLSDRQTVEAGPGSIICVNPGEVHDGHAIGGQARQWRMLYVDPRQMHSALSQIEAGDHAQLVFERAAFAHPPLHALLHAALSAMLGSMLHPVHLQWHSPAVEPMQLSTWLLNIVAELRPRRSRNLAARSAVPGSSSLQRVRDLIEADPADEELTLARLAREANLSTYQLIRAFARQYRLTPHAYIVQRRLSLARSLLRAGGPVAEVAQRTGFTDQAHLTHCFARQFGVAPARYAASVTRTPSRAIFYKN
jgi:AraC-like DNA-binding protein